MAFAFGFVVGGLTAIVLIVGCSLMWAASQDNIPPHEPTDTMWDMP